jgi:hypothetical protein
VGRANLIHRLLQDESTRFEKGSLANWAQSAGLQQIDRFLPWFEEGYLTEPLSESQRQRVLDLTKDVPADRAHREVLGLLAALPVFHLA